MEKIATHKNDQVVFTEHNHLYILNEKKRLISGTTFVKKFFTPFDGDRIAYYWGKKNGMTKHEVLAMWAEKGKNSSMYGTACHNHAEQIIKGESLTPPNNEREAHSFKKFEAIIKELEKHVTFLEPEMIVFSKEYGIAGTIDLPAISKDRETVIIYDWKTNESITRDNKYKKFALPPIEHMPDNNFDHYTLQLNLYQFIMVNDGWVPPGTKFKRILIHCNAETFEYIPVPDAQKEVLAMTRVYKAGEV